MHTWQRTQASTRGDLVAADVVGAAEAMAVTVSGESSPFLPDMASSREHQHDRYGPGELAALP